LKDSIEDLSEYISESEIGFDGGGGEEPTPEPAPAVEKPEPDRFPEFLAAFPKRRDGAGNPRKARKGWLAALDEGETPESLIVAAKGYAAERAAKVAREGEEQADWTLTPERWFERQLWKSAPADKAAAANAPVFVACHDEKWPELKARYRREKGGDPPTRDRREGGRIECGWDFPRQWLGLPPAQSARATKAKRSGWVESCASLGRIDEAIARGDRGSLSAEEIKTADMLIELRMAPPWPPEVFDGVTIDGEFAEAAFADT
jgi:hypothetical protein